MGLLYVRPTDAEIEQTVKDYANMLYKLSFVIVNNAADAADAVQDTFLKYVTSAPSFQSEEHKKAWLLRVAANISKNYRNYSNAHSHLNIESLYNLGCCDKEEIVLEAVLRLPEKYKIPIHLYYYEGYSVKELANILKLSQAAVLKRLQRGRQMLKEWLEE